MSHSVLHQPNRFGLPIVETGELWNPTATAVPPSGTDAVRDIDIGMAFTHHILSNSISLPEALAITDRVFERVAEDCGASVVDHEWCLAPYDPPNGYPHPLEMQSLIPKGLRLAARISIIEPTQDIEDEEAYRLKFVLGINKYPDDYRWDDERPEQFTLGTPRHSPEGQTRLWLHDIEPYIIPPGHNRA